MFLGSNWNISRPYGNITWKAIGNLSININLLIMNVLLFQSVDSKLPVEAIQRVLKYRVSKVINMLENKVKTFHTKVSLFGPWIKNLLS